MRGHLHKAKLSPETLATFKKGEFRCRLVVSMGRDPIKKTWKQKWITFQGTKKQAEAELRKHVTAIDKNQFVEPSKRTVGEWLVEWLAKVVKPSKRTATHKTYEIIITGRLIPALGAIPLQALRRVDLRAYYAEASKTLSPATVRMHHAILSSALQAAVDDDLVERNVAYRLKGVPKVVNRNENVNKNTWTTEEARNFLATVKDAGPRAAALYALALDSGARKSEIGGLRWSDIDLETGVMTILQQILTEDDPPEFGPTKTGKPRAVQLGNETLALLREHKKHQAELKMKNRATYRDLGLVFAKEWGDIFTPADRLGQPMRLHNIGTGEFGRLIKAAGVKRITFHGLRHTMASMMMQDGVATKVIMERLGHTQVATTMDIYAHVQPGMQEDAARRHGARLHG